MEKNKQATLTTVSSEYSCRPPMIQNFLLVWLDANIDETNNEECRENIMKLRHVVNMVRTFTNSDKCIQFIDSIREEEVFIICSGALGQTIVPIVHDKSPVGTIYIFCGNKARHEQWVQQWPKVNGVFTEIEPICETLKQAARDCDQNSVLINFITANGQSSSEDPAGIEQSSIYTQILKETLLTTSREDERMGQFLEYCREMLVGNASELKNADKLCNEYTGQQPIWWYTYDCFLYSMLNRALRTAEFKLIVKLGFFVRDLHRNIVQLHSEQYGKQKSSDTFIVYRGQGLSQVLFNQLKKTQGGLLAFSNFLSAHRNRNVSQAFARRIMETSNQLGVLFVIKVDPKISSSSFANTVTVHASPREGELLFSIDCFFRIEQIKHIDGNTRLWQVDLKLISNNDHQLQTLAERIQEEDISEYRGWCRLGEFLIKSNEFDKSQQLYEALLDQTYSDHDIAFIYHRLGYVNDRQGKFEEALTFYKQTMAIYETRSPNDLALANSYSAIGLVYETMGKHLEALAYYEKTLAIDRETLPSNHPDMINSCNSIASVYIKMDQPLKALPYYSKALEIKENTLPSNHPDLLTSYSNIGAMYDKAADYSKAIRSHEKALEIRLNTLPSNHPDLANSYAWLGYFHDKTGDYSRAIIFYEQAVDIEQSSTHQTHLQLYKDCLNNVKKKL